ncbi:TniQ family protein [Duganella margarita]
MSYQLPIRPTPYPDESAGSFLIRLAELNGQTRRSHPATKSLSYQ